MEMEVKSIEISFPIPLKFPFLLSIVVLVGEKKWSNAFVSPSKKKI